MFYELATKIGKKACWNKYQFNIDMVQAGYLKCIEKIDKFTLDRPNAFSYFTTIVHNVFIDYIKKENKQNAIKVKLIENRMQDNGNGRTVVKRYDSDTDDIFE